MNWHPFIPPKDAHGNFGWMGIPKGASRIFFAYIGFDAVSTAAQEAKKPQRDMPIGILGSLAICTDLIHPGVAGSDRPCELHDAERWRSGGGGH